jgi:four helix bundle protein
VLSVVRNFSEGSERGSDREFARFLAFANASNAEVQAQVMIAADLECLDVATSAQIVAQC